MGEDPALAYTEKERLLLRKAAIFLIVVKKQYNERDEWRDKMKAKDLLAALQVDADDSFNNLSTMMYVYADSKEKPVNRLVMDKATDEIIIRQDPKQPALTTKEFVTTLNRYKEADLYLLKEEKQLIYGYRLIKDGIVIS